MTDKADKKINNEKNSSKAIDELLNVVADQWKMKCISNSEKNYTQDLKKKDIKFLDSIIETHNKNSRNKIWIENKNNSIVEELLYKESLITNNDNLLIAKKRDWIKKGNKLCDFCGKSIYSDSLDATNIHLLDPLSLSSNRKKEASVICNKCHLLIHNIFSFNDHKWLTIERQREFILFISNLDVQKVDKKLITSGQLKKDDIYILKKPIERNLRKAFLFRDEKKITFFKNKLIDTGLTKQYIDDLVQEMEGYETFLKSKKK